MQRKGLPPALPLAGRRELGVDVGHSAIMIDTDTIGVHVETHGELLMIG